MKSILTTFILIFSCSAYAQDTLSYNDMITTIRLLNKVRISAGLDTVSFSPELTTGCNKHAKYLVLNYGNKKTDGLLAHNEYQDLAGYTKEGNSAASSSVIAFLQTPVESTDSWIACFYHRIPLLQPNLKEVGIGYYKQGSYSVSLINCITGVKGECATDIVYYPAPGQKNIPLTMATGEIPNPAPDFSLHGFPITIYFCKYQLVRNVKFTLSDSKGKILRCYLSTPEHPATSFTQWNTICAIPVKPLQPNSEYKVRLTCMAKKKPFIKTYKFYTAN